MKKIIAIAFLMAFVSLSAFAQNAPSVVWQKCFGGISDDRGYSIIQTFDSAFVVAGNTQSTDGDVAGKRGAKDTSDFWLIKISPSGTLIWQKCLGGTKDDKANSVIQTFDSGFVVVGYTSSNDSDVSGNHGKSDVWVVRLNAFGNIVWQKCLGGTGDDHGVSVIQVKDSGFVIAASSSSSDGDLTGNHGKNDAWIIKLGSSGNLLWQKNFGGSGDDNPTSIIQTNDNGYIFTGTTASTEIPGNHGGTDIWLVKLSFDGNMVWQKCFGGSSFDLANAVIQTYDSGYALAGYTTSVDGDVTGAHAYYDAWVVKTNSQGDLVWGKCIGGTNGDYFQSLIETPEHGIILFGKSASIDGDLTGFHNHKDGNPDLWIVKLNSSAEIEWEKCIGGTGFDYSYSAVQSVTGGFVAAGYTSSNDDDISGNHGSYDMLVVKFKEINEDVKNLQQEEPSFSIYPNPMSSLTEIGYKLLKSNPVILEVYNSLGVKVKFISKGMEMPGKHLINIDISELPEGIYYCKLTIDSLSQIQKIIVVK